jgi:hypothetical protein
VILLGQIRLQHRSSVYDARNKLRGLANALGYDTIETTRLATAVSGAARELRRCAVDPFISVALATQFSPPQLVLDFAYSGQAPDFVGLSGFFDGLSRIDVGQGVQAWRALKWLPTSNVALTEAFIAAQRQRIEQLSREELIAEIEQQNRDLERHS